MIKALVLAFLAGCGQHVVEDNSGADDTDIVLDDTGSDNGDTGTDTDSGSDTGSDTGGDTGTDTDSGSDTGSDTGGDTGTEPCDDVDGDGYCSEADGGDDCNDYAAAVNPGATEIVGNALDENCDGIVETEPVDTTVDGDADGYGEDVDCDDADASVYPGAAEIADDGIDQDCDGADEVTEVEPEPEYVDADGDGFSTDGGDCDDADADVSPAAIEVANDGIDQDCSGSDLVTETDADADGYGVSTDCDDTDAATNPGATEVCDGADNDCDGTVDDGINAFYWPDVDGDGDGAGSSVTECSAPSGYVANSADCDDADATIHEGASDACDDGVDQNCDGVDGDIEDLASFYADDDGDGYGDESVTPSADTCGPRSGYVAVGGDCDDSDPDVNPGESEILDDGIDNDCDGSDTSYSDLEDMSECPDGAIACFVDIDGDTEDETLLMEAGGGVWLLPELDDTDAEIYENGAGTGCSINGDTVEANSMGYYVIAFSGSSCTTQLSLTNDNSGSTQWWQNLGFCADTTDEVDICAETSPGNYLIDIDWRSSSGLQ